MQLKLSEIISLYYEINGRAVTNEDGTSNVLTNGILKQKISMKTRLYLHRLNKQVTEEFNTYATLERELFTKYGVEENGRLVITKDHIETFVKEQTDLLSATKNIDVKAIWGNEMTIENLSSIETDEDYPIFLKLVDVDNKA